MVPYLKGIHQTLDEWREGRDNDGWRISMAELKTAKDLIDEMQYMYSKNAPTRVYPATRLEDDVECLLKLFDSELPKVRHVRSKFVSMVLYGFLDASRSGFGSTIATDKGLKIRHGIWGSDSNKLLSFSSLATTQITTNFGFGEETVRNVEERKRERKHYSAPILATK